MKFLPQSSMVGASKQQCNFEGHENACSSPAQRREGPCEVWQIRRLRNGPNGAFDCALSSCTAGGYSKTANFCASYSSPATGEVPEVLFGGVFVLFQGATYKLCNLPDIARRVLCALQCLRLSLYRENGELLRT